jgi:hypothetical protein
MASFLSWEQTSDYSPAQFGDPAFLNAANNSVQDVLATSLQFTQSPQELF